MILQEFLTTNRQLLIGRCRDKVAKRFGLSETAATSDHGVPLFLQQLVETLREEQITHMRGVDSEPCMRLLSHQAQKRVYLNIPIKNP